MLNTVQSNPEGAEKTASKSEQDAWTLASARLLYELPFNDLLLEAQSVHRANFDPNRVQLSKLLNIKTGGCPEDCGYCSQSAHHASGLKASRLMSLDTVLEEAKRQRIAAQPAIAWVRPGAARRRGMSPRLSRWSNR